MDVKSFVIGHSKGYSKGKKMSFITEENEAGGLSYEFKGGEASNLQLNIAYGDTPPEDTIKLWVKTSEPSGVLISPEVEQTGVEGESLYQLPVTLPTPLYYAGCAAVGTKIYIIGGLSASGNADGSKSVIIYDTDTETFEVLEGVSDTGICNISCAVVGTRIYFFGGGNKISSKSSLIRYFDTENNELVTCTTQMPNTLYGYGCASLDSSIYVFGGTTGSSWPKTVYRFDTETETLSTICDAYYSQSGACVRKDNNFYLFGDNCAPNNLAIFNSITETTTTILNAFGNYIDMCAYGCLGDYIYAISGRRDCRIRRINVEDFTVETLPFETPVYFANTACATIGDKIYIFGGNALGESGSKITDSVYVFNKNTIVPSIKADSLYVKPNTDGNLWSMMKSSGINVQIGVDSVYKGNADGIGEPVEAALYKDGTWTPI